MSHYSDKSPFWTYFKDRLRFALIAFPGPIAALIHGLARYLDKVRQDVYWVRDQFVPPTSEDQHIPLHGESRSVGRIKYDTDTQYRLRVEEAALWHGLGGKVLGVPEILKLYGFGSARIDNVRLENPDLWAHFDVSLIRPPKEFSQGDVDAVIALINQYKPGRSVLRGTRFAAQNNAPMYLGAAAQTRITIHHYIKAREPVPPQPAVLFLGAASNMYVRIHHYIRG